MAFKSSKSFVSCPPHPLCSPDDGKHNIPVEGFASQQPHGARAPLAAGRRSWLGVHAPQTLALPPHSLAKPFSNPSFPRLGVLNQVRHLGAGSRPGLYSCAGDKERVRGPQVPAFSGTCPSVTPLPAASSLQPCAQPGEPCTLLPHHPFPAPCCQHLSFPASLLPTPLLAALPDPMGKAAQAQLGSMCLLQTFPAGIHWHIPIARRMQDTLGHGGGMCQYNDTGRVRARCRMNQGTERSHQG